MRHLVVFRWRAIVLVALLVLLLVVGWLVLLDTMVERGVERSGAYLVGARVDVQSADVRLGEGVVVLRGLQVTNPDAPMTNLLEAEEIVVDVRMAPLLERKVLLDTVALRGMRFGTPRGESGALDDMPPGSGRIHREIAQWAGAIRIPPLTLAGLRQAANLDAIQPESLKTVAEARASARLADSLVRRWDAELRALDPRPRIDSARALVGRLQTADPLRLGVSGMANLATSARGTLTEVQDLRARVGGLDSTALAQLTLARGRLDALAASRASDIAFGLSLLELPTLEGPQLSPAIFGDAVIAWVRPVLYWLRLAEEYLPPGLRPRRYAGADRVRGRGTTVLFPTERSDPRFLFGNGEASFVLAGSPNIAGEYRVHITGLTSDPALYGKPLALVAERAQATRGPASVKLAVVLNHVARPVRDSVDVVLREIGLPALDLRAIGARLLLGRGATELSVRRTGDQLSGRWTWRTTDASWERLAADTAQEVPSVGSRRWVEELLWRAVSGVRAVDLELQLSGDIRWPSLAVRSNVGEVVARALRQEVGREVERVERDVRERVDALTERGIARAHEGVDALQAKLTNEIASRLAELEALEAQLRDEIRKLSRRLPEGLPVP
jgi:uncharacterized protein (TIGR03545 family)